MIHFAVAPMHWRDWLPSGVFFAVLATFQLVWAFVAWSRQNTLVLAAGIAANVGAASLWVMSCITGPPVGPSAGQAEEVAAAGICVLLLQLYIVMGAGWAWSRKHQAEEVSGFGRAVVLMGANAIVAGAVTLGVAASFHGNHHHHHGGAAEAQGEHHAHHEAHMDADGHMEGHHHPSEPESPPAAGVVTDMSLEADDDHHAEPAEPTGGTATRSVPAAPAPAAVVPTAKPAPAQPPSSAADSDSAVDSDGEAGGHQHHHDD